MRTVASFVLVLLLSQPAWACGAPSAPVCLGESSVLFELRKSNEDAPIEAVHTLEGPAAAYFMEKNRFPGDGKRVTKIVLFALGDAGGLMFFDVEGCVIDITGRPAASFDDAVFLGLAPAMALYIALENARQEYERSRI